MYDSQAEYPPEDMEHWDPRQASNEQEWYQHQDEAYEKHKQIKADADEFWDKFRESVRGAVKK